MGVKDKIITVNDKIPIGAAVAFKSKLFLEYGPFHPELDRRGKKAFGGGETLFLSRAISRGCSGAYCANIKVNHNFISAKMDREYWLKHAWYGGRSNIRMLRIHNEIVVDYARYLSHLGGLMYRIILMIIAPKRRFENLYSSVAHAGNLFELSVGKRY